MSPFGPEPDEQIIKEMGKENDQGRAEVRKGEGCTSP